MHDILAVASSIRAVTVYRSGATVTRWAELPGERPEQVLVRGLPLSLQDGSVRVRVEGEGAEAPVAADVRIGLDVAGEGPPEPPDEAAWRRARRDLALADSEVERVEAMVASLERLAPPPRPQGRRGEPPPVAPTEARLQLLQFRAERLAALDVQLAVVRQEARRARECFEDLDLRRNLATTDRVPRPDELFKAAVVTLRGGGAGTWALVLEYAVPGARWTPSYTLRFSADYLRAGLGMRARVAQASGEDWSGVALTLSTALPLAWTELPELPSLRYGRRQPPAARRGWREPPQGAGALFADYDRAVERMRVALQPPEPEPVSALAAPPLAPPQEQGQSGPSGPFGSWDEPAGLQAALRSESSDDRREVPRPSPQPRAKGARKELARPMAPPPPPAAMPSRGGLQPPGLGVGAAAAAVAAAEPEPELTELVAPVDLMDFSRLRMRGPEAADRGNLRPATRFVLYQELLVSVQVKQSTLTVIEEAGRAAGRVGALALPDSCYAPAEIDRFDHAWSSDHRVDVPSDGGWHSVPLFERDATASLSYVVVPRESSDVFRVASFDNPLPAPLPRGPADVYLGGDLLLTTALRTVPAGGRLDLGLGVEQGIAVARNTQYDEKSAGLLGGHLGLNHRIEIDVRNKLSRPAKVEVRERVPVVREGQDDIALSVVAVEPAWEPWAQPEEPIDGGHRWRIELQPAASRTLRAQYTVSISSKHELVGGNRREA